VSLTGQMLSGQQLLRYEHGGHLHHQLRVGQPPPGEQRGAAQRGQSLRHEHPSVWSEAREQHVTEVQAMDPAARTAVPHRLHPVCVI